MHLRGQGYHSLADYEGYAASSEDAALLETLDLAENVVN